MRCWALIGALDCPWQGRLLLGEGCARQGRKRWGEKCPRQGRELWREDRSCQGRERWREVRDTRWILSGVGKPQRMQERMLGSRVLLWIVWSQGKVWVVRVG